MLLLDSSCKPAETFAGYIETLGAIEGRDAMCVILPLHIY